MSGGMSVADAVRARRAVRDIMANPIDAGLLHRIVSLALEAPSSWNHQSRSVVVVTDANEREGLFHATGGQRVVARAPVTLVFVGELDDPTADHEEVHRLAISRGAWSREVSPRRPRCSSSRT